MLNRQRLILALLDGAGGSAEPATLMLLGFLLGHETVVGRDATFYRFVPGRDGPFSFGLDHELQTLERDGFLERGPTSLSSCSPTERLRRQQVERLDAAALEAVRSVVQQYGSGTRPTLLRDVCWRFPWYASRCRSREALPDDVPALPRRDVAVHTAGYEGKSVDGFFDDLLAAGITGIVDVRANPVSRKYGFAKRSLRGIAAQLGLAYQHLPELGIPGDRRGSLSDFASYQRLLDEYETTMLPSQAKGMQTAARLLRSRPSVLLCVERDVGCCHRGRLANRIAEDEGLPVIHL
jgi:hypothetical protein